MKRKINKRKVAVHVLAWVAAFFINMILLQGYSFEIDLGQTLVTWLFYMLIFYVNYFILIPKFFNRKRLVIYIFSVLLLLGVSFLSIRYYSAVAADRRTSRLWEELTQYEDVRESFEHKSRMQERARARERERERRRERENEEEKARGEREQRAGDRQGNGPVPGGGPQGDDGPPPGDGRGPEGRGDGSKNDQPQSDPVQADTVPQAQLSEEIVFTEREEEYGRLRWEFDRARRTEHMIYGSRYNPFEMYNMRIVYALVFFYMASIVVFFIEQSSKNERRRRELEKEKVSAELAYLKQQINPHFLFNTLNSIYSYTIGASAPASDAVLKLSSILRYMLYETGRDRVPLIDELTVMDDYIELQKLRMTDKTEVDVAIEGDTRMNQIEPMLLIPILENAFKFGVDSVEPSFIRIEMQVKGNDLTFRVTNRIVRRSNGDHTNSGIGIRNIRRRLDLIYGPGNYILETTEKDDVFTVLMKLNLR